jgi:hypothetical protein
VAEIEYHLQSTFHIISKQFVEWVSVNPVWFNHAMVDKVSIVSSDLEKHEIQNSRSVDLDGHTVVSQQYLWDESRHRREPRLTRQPQGTLQPRGTQQRRGSLHHRDVPERDRRIEWVRICRCQAWSILQ